MAFKFPDYPEGVHLPPEYTPASLPPCECDDCKQSFLTAQQQQCYAQFRYREWPSHAADLVRVSSHFVRQASEAKDHVAERLSLHADLLMNRWRKRSQEKRRQLLHDVAPELEEKQWIVPRHVYEVGWNQKPNDRTPERRRHLLLPWLSVEGLTTNPTLLFALLYYRSRYPLYDWAAYDSRQLELSWQSGHFDLCHAASCVVMYGPRYGAIVDWDEKQAHTGHIIGFPRARLVLEAQALLFTVLSKIVDAILLGVDDSTTTPRTEKWRLQTTMGFRSAEEIERWSPYTFSPFSEPPRLDVDYLVSLAKTRREEAFDHLTDLQCDPMYLRRYIKPILDKKLLDSEKGERVSELAMDILDDVTDYLMWLWTEQECLKVRALHKRFSDSVYPGRPMPPKYDQALGSLEGLLSIWMNQFGGIDRKLRCAPGFLHYSKRVRVDYHGSSAIGVKRVRDVNTKESLEGDRLDWCLSHLANPPDADRAFDHAMLFAMLQSHLSQSDRKEAARVDAMLLRKLSNRSASHEALMSIWLHRPRNRCRGVEGIKQSELETWWKVQSQTMDEVTFTRQICARMVKTGRFIEQGFFNVKPPTGPKNEAWLRKAQSLRSVVDQFWKLIGEAVEFKFISHCRYKLSQEEIKSILDITNPSLKPEYAAAVAREEAQVTGNAERQSAPVPDVFINRDAQPKSLGLETLTIREPKVKTRPDRAGEIDEAAQETENTEEAPVEPEPAKIPVSERTLKLVNLMYPVTGEHEGKDVLWDELVHAMVDAGFVASNNGGSAVRFEIGTGVNGVDSGSIIFHKPHPVAKIDPIMLRSMGRRMTKWFGWNRERFVAR